MKRISYSLILILLTVGLNSCIDIQRTIKINPDGTGTEKQILNVSKTFYDMMISIGSAFDSTKVDSIRDSLYNDTEFETKAADKIRQVEGLNVLELNSITQLDSSRTYTVMYSFDKVEKIAFGSDLSKEGMENKKGTSELSYTQNGNIIDFRYKYTSQSDSAETQMTEEQKKGMMYLFEGKKLVFEIEFPYEVIYSNALRADNRTLYWEFPVADMSLKDGGFELKATLQVNP